MANLSGITKKYVFNLFLDGLFILSSLICSYPLYVLYLCYFTPYILKILFFLYPLFITTSLLVISLVTAISPCLVKDTFLGTESSKLKSNSLLSAYDIVSKILQLKNDGDGEDFHSLEALEVYNIVFDTSMLDEPGIYGDVSDEYPKEKILQTVESSVLKISKNDEQDCFVKTEVAFKGDNLKQDSSIDDRQLKSIKSVIRKFEDLLKKPEEEIKTVQIEINQTFDILNGEQLVEAVHYDNSRKDPISKSKNSQPRRQNTRTNINHTENNSEYTSKEEGFRQSRSGLGRYGSTRKEREWRTTLACKLFEEKHNSTNDEGIEGMDLLWEKYDEGEPMDKNMKTETKKIISSKFKNSKYEDEDEDDDVGVNLCCLQAFKLSTTKMNLGVGRRNFAKISKAVKGLGWMHKATKHSKKVHNNNGDTLQFP